MGSPTMRLMGRGKTRKEVYILGMFQNKEREDWVM